MTSYKRDLYFSEQHKKEIIRLCETTPKLSINSIEKFCSDAKDEILTWRKKRSLSENVRENISEDHGRSYDNVPENKSYSIYSEDEDEIVPLHKPYNPRSPIGIHQCTPLLSEEIEEIRLNFIEQIYFATVNPIEYEDLASLVVHAGQPMCVEDLLSLFGFSGFAPMIREMPEFYFLDVYMGVDGKLWYLNKQMSSKTKFFQLEETHIPKKGVQISIAETAYKELDMILFKGRKVFIEVLEKCLKDGRDENGWISLTTFQDYLGRNQKQNFKDAWKSLMPEIGQIKRVWNEVVYRDMTYDSETNALKLNDKPRTLFDRIEKEQKAACEFWNKLNIKMKEFSAAEKSDRVLNDSHGESWGNDSGWSDEDTTASNIANGNGATDDTVENVIESSKLESEKSVDRENDADNEFEQLKTENQDMNNVESNVENLSNADESQSSESKEILTPTPTIEEATAVSKPKVITRKSSRVIPDGPESDDEDYRVENCPARSETLLFNLISTEEDKAKDKSVNVGENSEVVEILDEQINESAKEKKNESKNTVENEIDQKEMKLSEDLPGTDVSSEIIPTTVSTVDEEEKNGETKADVGENTEPTCPAKEDVKDTKYAQQKESLRNKLPVTKSKFKKKSTFSSRKLPSAKVPDGSESDAEDVRMENVNPVLNIADASMNLDSKNDVQELKPDNVVLKLSAVSKKMSEPRKTFCGRMKNDKKPKYNRSYYIPPVDQDTMIFQANNEWVKMFGLRENLEMKKEDKKVDKKKAKQMMDFGSEAEYTDEDSPSPSEEKNADEKEYGAKEMEKDVAQVKPTSLILFKSNPRSKQFKARTTTGVMNMKSPRKLNSNALFDADYDSDDVDKKW